MQKSIPTAAPTSAQLSSLILFAASAIVLVGMQEKAAGWAIFFVGLITTLVFTRRSFRNHIASLYASLSLLGLVHIGTETSTANLAGMGLVLTFAVAIPYIASRYIFKDNIVTFQFHHGRRWTNKEIFYIFFSAFVVYLVLPFYLRDTEAYLNWQVDDSAQSIGRLFFGTNALGIWDELFFISTVLGVLRHHVRFVWANLLQAFVFTSFLFELGFTGWAPLLIYPFALIQGYLLKRTDSLFYVITVHLAIDFVLFLALVNAHFPEKFDIFIT